jgi:phosphatidylserine/phosphatidylglycerophosphate/cardiolipin synthase-like enzyme
MPSARSYSEMRVFFGGPDRPPRVLRDLLHARICAVPPGGEICWATYYFCDEALARALVQARDRGVTVRLSLEDHPRTPRANHAVRSILQSAGFGDDFRAVRHSWPDNLLWKKPRLHLKLYYFSYPEPHVLVGTFNPSGNTPADPDLLAEIGDQDRGHNHLVELSDSRLVVPLHDHLRMLHNAPHGPWERFLPRNNRAIVAVGSRIYLFPRVRRSVLLRKLAKLPAGTVLRMAVSHLNDKGMGKLLCRLAQRGLEISVLTHDTERRVPQWIERQLQTAVTFCRYQHAEGLPMHNKFMLIDTPGRQEVVFGSMNLSERSLHANHELLVVSNSPLLYNAFRNRWEEMIHETEERAQ